MIRRNFLKAAGALVSGMPVVAQGGSHRLNSVEQRSRPECFPDHLNGSALTATAMSVLSNSERNEGVCMLDIGRRTTEMSVCIANKCRHYETLRFGGDHITTEIAARRDVPFDVAERMKIDYGFALSLLLDPRAVIPPPAEAFDLVDIVQGKFEELFSKTDTILRKTGFRTELRHGIVLAGGPAKTPGIVELGEECFHNIVRVASKHRAVAWAVLACS
jgi:cell division protein FtsA